MATDQGRGLGDLFLGHVEKCSVLLHMIDVTAGDFLKNYKIIMREVMAYGSNLADKPIIVAMNKIDTLDEEELVFFKEELEALCGQKVFPMSAVTGDGIPEVLRALRYFVKSAHSKIENQFEGDVKWQP